MHHGQVSGGWNPYLKEALQTMFETGLPAIVFEELTGRNTTLWTALATCAGYIISICEFQTTAAPPRTRPRTE